MSKHTPGPWRFNNHRSAPTEGSIVSNQSHPICRLSEAYHRQCEGPNGSTYTGNDGPLIAAAPELLAALTALTEACLAADAAGELPECVDGRLLDAARTAIAKATEGTT